MCTSATYRRREPEKTALYQVMQQNLETFLERARDPESGSRLPGFVVRELYDYLGCGILANGFARVRCTACGKEIAVGFS